MRWIALALSVALSVSTTGVADALVISSNTTWTDPAPLNDSLTINSGVTLRILNGNGTDGGDFVLNLPNGGTFSILNGGILNMNAQLNNGRSGDLTVNLTGPSGTVNIAGAIVAQGLGTGRGGVLTLNGSSFNLPSTGVIYANSPLGLGGRVVLNNTSGLIDVQNGFQIVTSGLSDPTHNLIDIDGVGVNINGTLDTNGTLAGTGGAGGTVDITATGGASDVNINNQVLAAGIRGQNGGTISITAGRDVNINNNLGGQLIAASGGGGTNIGNGGNVTLDANRHITITSNNGNYAINVNASENPTTTTGNGVGGNVFLTADTGNITIDQSTTGFRGVIEANGAVGGAGRGGVIQFLKAADIDITNTASSRISLLARGGQTGTATGGNGGTIRMGGDGPGEDITGNITIDDSVLWTLAGNVNQNSTGHGGTINIELDGTFSATHTTIQALSAGNAGNGGSMRLVSNAGDINLTDGDSWFLLWSNGSGTVDVSGVNISNAGTIGSRAARISNGPALNTNNGGVVNVTATGILTNTGEINASAWTPRLDYIPTNEESSGAGGQVNIIANSMTNNGLGGSRSGNILAYGGLNTQGSTQGRGGRIDINVTNGFSMNNQATIDSRGEPNQPTLPTGQNRIAISAGSVTVDGQINASGFFANDAGGHVDIASTAGNIDINAGALVSASGGIGDIFNNAGPGGSIQLDATGGNVNIAGDVHAIGRTGFPGGNITANATGGTVNITGVGTVHAQSEFATNRGGNGGTINLNAGTLNINSTLATSVLSVDGNINGGGLSGSGGTININSPGARGAVLITTNQAGLDGLISAEGGMGTLGGNGGNINLYATNVSFTGTGGQRLMTTNNVANGLAGNLLIDATGTYDSIDGSHRTIATTNGGRGGSITLNAGGNTNLTGTTVLASGQNNVTGNIDMTIGGTLTTASNSHIVTEGETDATHNNINITAGVIDIQDGRIDADGEINSGSEGGNITLTSTTGDITINDNLQARGQIASASRNANGGNITLNSFGNITITGNVRIRANSQRRLNVQPLDGGTGGTVSMTAGTGGSGNISLTSTGPVIINVRGAHFNNAADDPIDLQGGLGGTVTLDANNGIDFLGGSGNEVYIQARGGNGRGDLDGGDGGNVTFNLNGGPGYTVASPGSRNFDVRQGNHQGGGSGSNGTAGTFTVNP